MRRDAGGNDHGHSGVYEPGTSERQTADKRADIWSFGVVLWEMLTGKRLFEGETVSHILAAVLKDEPDREAGSAEDPPPVAIVPPERS